MKTVVRLLIMSAAALSMLAGVAQALPVVYTDREAWAVDVALDGSYHQVSFKQAVTHTGTLNAQIDKIDYNSGTPIIPTDLQVNVRVHSQQTDPLMGVSGIAPGGQPLMDGWRDQVRTGTTTTFYFDVASPWGAKSIGGDWDLKDPYSVERENGGGLKFTVIYCDGTQGDGGSIAGGGSTETLTFLGWKSETDKGIAGLLIESATGADESFLLQNLSFTQAIPEPSTFILLGAGFGGLMILRRRGQRSAA